MLSHIKGRALSLVRYPDGLGGEKFFQKNRPEWAPEWVAYKRLGNDRKKEYVVANEEATLVWLANLACLEIHQMHSFSAHNDTPDYIVYDLDPPEDGSFAWGDLKRMAFDLKAHLDQYGYHPFLKTTGGKGLHVLTPITPKYTYEECFQVAREIATSFIAKYPKATLHLVKASRKGRVLIDIYRNKSSQTIISPYSLRGHKGATTSTPITWDELENLKTLTDWNIHTTLQRLLTEGDAWEQIRGWAVPLHTDPNKKTVSAYSSQTSALKAYKEKRDFAKTNEPDIATQKGMGNRFVIQRHHAAHIHYDLRLEQNGVLTSWAVPKGMPPIPGVKRLAVKTEDHPLSYLSFEGNIPKGEYGGGTMWVYAEGKYEVTKEKKDGFYFRLSGKQLNAEYRIHLMKGKEWLLERVDTPQHSPLNQLIKPMLAESSKNVPLGDYTYELKWDGIRALIYINEGELKIYSRNLNDITHQFPELNIPPETFGVNNAIFDGEIVCLDSDGSANFKKVIKRLMSKARVKRENVQFSAFCYLFDCLYLDGRPLLNDPLYKRREWLEDALSQKCHPYRINEVLEDGVALFEATKRLGVEGILAKEKNGTYMPGKRSKGWIKVKVKTTMDCVIIGYTQGQGDRIGLFGSLQLAEVTQNGLTYRGRVGTGFDQKQMKSMAETLSAIVQKTKPISEGAHEERITTWVSPIHKCEVEYTMLTESGTLRDPVFKKLIGELDGLNE